MKKIISILSVLMALCILLAGCGAKSSAETDYLAYDMDSPAASESSASGEGSITTEDYYGGGSNSGASGVSASELAESGLKIIYRAYLSVETLEYDESLAAVSAALKAQGGYMESSDEYGGYRYSSGRMALRSCTLALRIPAENYEAFLAEAGSFGSVLSRSESTEDITSSYLDVEARLSSLETQEQRLLELLEQADSIETLLAIEDKLADVRYEIESYTSTMRTYENQLSYSTVTIDLSEVTTPTPTETRGFFQRVWDAVKNSAESAVDFLDSLVIFLIYAIPYLALAALAAWAVVAIVRCRRKKAPERAEKRAARHRTEPGAQDGAGKLDGKDS